MKKSVILLFFISGCALISCKKDEVAPSVKDILTSKTWKSTGFIENGSPQSAWCWLNSLYDYTTEGKLFVEQGDDHGACSGGTIGEITKFSWTLSTDEKWLVTHYGSSPPQDVDSFEIESINTTTLKTKRVVNKSTPSPDTWEDTFTAQ